MLFLMSFIYKLVETPHFPDKTDKKIYEKSLIGKVYIYHVLTDTDSTCFEYIFLSSTDSDIPNKKFKNKISEVILASKIYYRFDSSKFTGKILGWKRIHSYISWIL